MPWTDEPLLNYFARPVSELPVVTPDQLRALYEGETILLDGDELAIKDGPFRLAEDVVKRHHGPGPHPSGSEQSAHAGGFNMATGSDQNAKLLDWHPEAQDLIWISPRDYLSGIAKDLGAGYGIRSSRQGIREKNVAELKEKIGAGQPMDALWVDYDVAKNKIVSQEGRHRSWAAIDLGIDAVPVIVYFRREYSYLNIERGDVDAEEMNPWRGQIVRRHHAPIHPGTGTDQSVHAGEGSVAGIQYHWKSEEFGKRLQATVEQFEQVMGGLPKKVVLITDDPDLVIKTIEELEGTDDFTDEKIAENAKRIRSQLNRMVGGTVPVNRNETILYVNEDRSVGEFEYQTMNGSRTIIADPIEPEYVMSHELGHALLKEMNTRPFWRAAYDVLENRGELDGERSMIGQFPPYYEAVGKFYKDARAITQEFYADMMSWSVRTASGIDNEYLSVGGDRAVRADAIPATAEIADAFVATIQEHFSSQTQAEVEKAAPAQLIPDVVLFDIIDEVEFYEILPKSKDELVERHYGPGNHPGTGTGQDVHAGRPGTQYPVAEYPYEYSDEPRNLVNARDFAKWFAEVVPKGVTNKIRNLSAEQTKQLVKAFQTIQQLGKVATKTANEYAKANMVIDIGVRRDWPQLVNWDLPPEDLIWGVRWEIDGDAPGSESSEYQSDGTFRIAVDTFMDTREEYASYLENKLDLAVSMDANERLAFRQRITLLRDEDRAHEAHSAYWFGGGIESAIYHELGHHVHNLYSKKMADWAASESDQWTYDDEFGGVKFTALNIFEGWQPQYAVTARAGDSWTEAVAENFTLWVSGHGNAIHPDMKKAFDNIFSGGGQQAMEFKHASPVHPGTGSDQSVHGGNGGDGDDDGEWKPGEDEHATWADTDELVWITGVNKDGTFNIEVESGADRGATYEDVAPDDLWEPDDDLARMFSFDDIASLEGRAENVFGLTEDFGEAGYILDDGRMLDFSGKNQGGPGGMRSLDHRDISKVLPDEAGSGTDGMIWWMENARAIRFSFQSGDIMVDMAAHPTRAQVQKIEDAYFAAGGEGAIYVDVSGENGNVIHSAEFDPMEGGVTEFLYDAAEAFTRRSWVARVIGRLRRLITPRHYGPGNHPGTGSGQDVHGGTGALSGGAIDTPPRFGSVEEGMMYVQDRFRSRAKHGVLIKGINSVEVVQQIADALAIVDALASRTRKVPGELATSRFTRFGKYKNMTDEEFRDRVEHEVFGTFWEIGGKDRNNSEYDNGRFLIDPDMDYATPEALIATLERNIAHYLENYDRESEFFMNYGIEMEKSVKLLSDEASRQEAHSMYSFPPDKRLVAMMLHEFGHHVHNLYNTTQTDEAEGMWYFFGPSDEQKDEAGITARARDNWHEAVAENFTLWALGRDVSPYMQDSFDELFGSPDSLRIPELVERHYGPGNHPGTGSDQGVHAGGGGGAPLGRPELLPVARLALHYDSPKEMERNWHANNFHGVYFHLTNDADFEVDPERVPREGSSIGSTSTTPGLMVTTDMENWTETMGERPFVALIEMPDLVPNRDYGNTTRGFGHEIFIFKPEGAKVIDVMPYADALKWQENYYENTLPQSSKELREVWEWAHANMVQRHHGPGPHPSGSEQSVHAGNGSWEPSESEFAKLFQGTKTEGIVFVDTQNTDGSFQVYVMSGPDSGHYYSRIFPKLMSPVTDEEVSAIEDQTVFPRFGYEQDNMRFDAAIERLTEETVAKLSGLDENEQEALRQLPISSRRINTFLSDREGFDNDYDRISDHQIEYYEEVVEEQEAEIALIDGAIERFKLPMDMQLFRGWEYIPDDLSPGDEFTYTSYAPTTADYDTVHEFSDDDRAIVQINAREGSTGVFTGLQDRSFSPHPEEFEVILPRNSRFRYIGRDDDLIYMELVK